MSTQHLAKWVPKPPAVPADCADCPIRGLTVCRPFQGPTLDVVQDFKLEDRILPAGSQLYFPEQELTELYNLLDGWVFLYRILESGRRQIIDLALPGSFLGYQPNLHAPILHGAECLTDVAVCVFPRKPFDDLAREHPSLSFQLAKVTSQVLIRTQDHLTNVGSRPVLARIARLLCEILYRSCSPQLPLVGEAVGIPLTQTHIADALGLTSVYVNKTLRELREKGILIFKGGQLTVLDLGRLTQLAEFQLEMAAYENSLSGFPID
jgi:CRP-like cAMP-binding protein